MTSDKPSVLSRDEKKQLLDDEIKNVIQKIIDQHQVILKPDDPLLMMVTLQEHLLEKQAQRWETLLEQHARQTEQMSMIYDEKARQRAEHVLNALLKASKETIETSITEPVERINKLLEKRNQIIQTEHQVVYQKLAKWVVGGGIGLALPLFYVASVILRAQTGW